MQVATLLRLEISKLQNELSRKQQALSLLGGRNGVAHGKRQGPPLSELVPDVISKAGKPLNAHEIYDGLAKRGRSISKPTLQSFLYKAIKKSGSGIKHVKPGKFNAVSVTK